METLKHRVHQENYFDKWRFFRQVFIYAIFIRLRIFIVTIDYLSIVHAFLLNQKM